MGDDAANSKKRRTKWINSYLNMTMGQAEERPGFRIRSLEAVSVDSMLACTKHSLGAESVDIMLKVKKRVYDNIVEYLVTEGYPTEGDPDFKEGNANDLVYAIISPILGSFIHMTGRKSIQLRREKEIVSTGGETGGAEEFVMVDLVSITEKFLLIVEAKSTSLGQAMKQCLLAMKDIGDNNTDGKVYGFVTTGESWRMLSYDGVSFKLTDRMDVIFRAIDREKEKWMKSYSVLVDCMYAVLSNRDTKKEVVAG